MRIGFLGAHRTGKTTLARAISRIYNLPLLTNRISDTVAEFNFDMAAENRLDTGNCMQLAIISRMLDDLEAAQRTGFVSDRTPLDAAAYYLADANAYAGTPPDRDRVVLYVEQAMRQTAKLFDLVILVPPAITFEAAPGKPPMNAAYQEHHHMLVRGMLCDDEIKIPTGQIARTNTDRADRIAAACDFIAARFPQHIAA